MKDTGLIEVEIVTCRNPLLDEPCWWFKREYNDVELVYGIPETINNFTRATQDIEKAACDLSFLHGMSKQQAEEYCLDIKRAYEMENCRSTEA